MRQGQSHHPHGLDQIPLHGGAPVVIGAVSDARPTPAAAHIVDQDVDPAESRNCRLDQTFRLFGLADIGDAGYH